MGKRIKMENRYLMLQLFETRITKVVKKRKEVIELPPFTMLSIE
jgi:hypothetical protein